jgi:hypothetical protein
MAGAHGPEAIEQLRRSAACAALSPQTVEEILAGYAELARRQREIGRLLHQAMPPWRSLKDTLNRVAAILSESDEPDRA